MTHTEISDFYGISDNMFLIVGWDIEREVPLHVAWTTDKAEANSTARLIGCHKGVATVDVVRPSKG